MTRYGRSLRRLMALLLALAYASAPRAEAHAAPADGHAAAAPAEHGPDADHGEEHANTDPLAVDPDLAIFTLLVFLALFAVLKKFAWGPISAALEGREKKISDSLLAAQQANEEGQRLLAQYEAKLAAAQEEVRAIIEEARRDAEHTQQEILAQARTDAQAEMARATREVEMARDQALRQLAETGAELAVSLAGKIVGQKLNAADHAALIRQAVQNVAPASNN